MRQRSLALTVAFATSIAIAGALPAIAVSTRSFVLDDADAFGAGTLERTMAHSTGAVTVGVELHRIELANTALAMAVARGPGGEVYVGTGNDGKIFKLTRNDIAPFAETGQLVVTSLAVTPNGTVYAGTLPEGRIFAITPAGTTTELARPEGVQHVWALVWNDRTQRLIAATGPEGKVVSIDAQGQAEVLYDSDAPHVMCLAFDGQGAVLAGTSEHARLVRITGPGRAEVVYDFPGTEVTAVSVREGVIAVAANEFGEPPAAVTPTKAPVTAPLTAATAAAPVRPRVGKGRLWRIGPEGRAEQIYSNDEGHFTSVYVAAEGVFYAASGAGGRIYRVAEDRTSAIWVDVDERQVLAMDLGNADPVFATGDAGAVYRVVAGRPTNPLWTSKVLDAQFTSRFGELTWRATGPIELQTRSGNTSEPDTTWSEWSAALTSAGPIRSPAARFLQVRARFTASPTTVLRAVTAYYLPQNQRAVVHSVRLATKNAGDAGVTDPAIPSTKLKLKWEVSNLDQDRVRYRLRFRAEDQTAWREMQRECDVLTAAEYEWDTVAVPDGYYIVRVEVSDETANPDPFVLRANADSEPLLVDNHAPTLEGLTIAAGHVRGNARDTLGPISKLEYAIDGGEWHLFFPTDHLLDQAEESFDFPLPAGLAPGPHIVSIRATDSAGNSAVGDAT